METKNDKTAVTGERTAARETLSERLIQSWLSSGVVNPKERQLADAAPVLLEALKGIAWKIQAYGSHWEPSQAEREAISAAIANAERGGK